jgi:hypothetical protein
MPPANWTDCWELFVIEVAPVMETVAPSSEEGCKHAHLRKVSIYDWLEHGAFREERKRHREAVVECALDSLKANTA